MGREIRIVPFYTTDDEQSYFLSKVDLRETTTLPELRNRFPLLSHATWKVVT